MSKKDVSSSLPVVEPVFADSINVVFAADQNYLPYLGVTLLSLVENASASTNYDICILHDGHLDTRDFPLEKLTRENISIRFVTLDLDHYPYDFSQHLTGHYTMATYYRFFISKVFRQYERILYLDCDIIILADVAELFALDLDGKLLAAGPDRCHYLPDSQGLHDYIVQTLGIPFADYFCCGVMLLDIGKLRAAALLSRALQKLADIGTPKLVDQDVFNALFHDQAKILPACWNVMWSVFLTGDQKEKTTYKKTALPAKIIHYDSSTKPWAAPKKYLARYWWEYAQKLGMTPPQS